MKKIITTLTAIGVLSLTSHVFAASGPYVEVQGGIGGMNTKSYSADLTTENPYSEVDLRNGIAYRAAAGYLWGKSKFNFGAEVGYANYAKNTYELYNFKQTYSGSYFDFLGVAKYRFGEDDNRGLYMLGKAGVAYVTQKFEEELYGETIYENQKKEVKPEVVFGLGYDFNKNFGMDLSFHHVFGGEADPASGDEESATKLSAVNLLMLGATVHFG